jgi:hypothetical protein
MMPKINGGSSSFALAFALDVCCSEGFSKLWDAGAGYSDAGEFFTMFHHDMLQSPTMHHYALPRNLFLST